mmetsp:Transcript_35897/g.99229  ORF Transcript_35897/g.99229 Transcript_35897/m.99229 type:complete len:213 (-) Transcript_35897:36-674(-)
MLHPAGAFVVHAEQASIAAHSLRLALLVHGDDHPALGRHGLLHLDKLQVDKKILPIGAVAPHQQLLRGLPAHVAHVGCAHRLVLIEARQRRVPLVRREPVAQLLGRAERSDGELAQRVLIGAVVLERKAEERLEVSFLHRLHHDGDDVDWAHLVGSDVIGTERSRLLGLHPCAQRRHQIRVVKVAHGRTRAPDGRRWSARSGRERCDADDAA